MLLLKDDHAGGGTTSDEALAIHCGLGGACHPCRRRHHFFRVIIGFAIRNGFRKELFQLGAGQIISTHHLEGSCVEPGGVRIANRFVEVKRRRGGARAEQNLHAKSFGIGHVTRAVFENAQNDLRQVAQFCKQGSIELQRSEPGVYSLPGVELMISQPWGDKMDR